MFGPFLLFWIVGIEADAVDASVPMDRAWRGAQVERARRLARGLPRRLARGPKPRRGPGLQGHDEEPPAHGGARGGGGPSPKVDSG